MTTEEKLQVIRQHFKDKGMKQADVAKALGVSRATVCNLMNGAPFGRRTAYEWSKTFGFSKDFLVNGVEPVYEEDKGRECSDITQNITGNSGIAVQQAGVQGCTRVQAQAPAQMKAGANDSYFARLRLRLPYALTLYCARHTWGTVARSAMCRIDKSIVHEALCHVDGSMRVTDIYAEKDWSVIWDANARVLSLFFP